MHGPGIYKYLRTDCLMARTDRDKMQRAAANAIFDVAARKRQHLESQGLLFLFFF